MAREQQQTKIFIYEILKSEQEDGQHLLSIYIRSDAEIAVIS